MKLFTKLALVSAVAVSGSAMAMESMDDSALSSTTGQEGITVGIGVSKITIGNVYVHDADGLKDGLLLDGTTQAQAVRAGGTAAAKRGAITVNNVTIASNPGTGFENIVTMEGTPFNPGSNTGLLAKLNIDADGGDGTSGATTGAFLNIDAAISGLDINVGSIGVATSNDAMTGTNGTVRGIVAGSEKAILSNLNIKTGKMFANIQLGSTPQGAMINLNGTMKGGLGINGLEINDAAGGGLIKIDSIKVADAGVAGTADLSINAQVGINTNGLKITAAANPTNVYVSGIHLGTATAASIGDIEVSNMQVFHGLAGTTPGAEIYVTGH